MSYKNYKLFLRDPNTRWLSNIHNVFRNQWDKLDNDSEFQYLRIYSSQQNIVSEKLRIHNLKSLPIKYTRLLKEVLRIYECKGIYNRMMVHNEVFVTVEIWGYEPDVILCHNMLDYIINGTLKVRDNIQKEMRRRKINARRRGESKSLEHARSLANEVIKERLIYLEGMFKNFEVKHSIYNEKKQEQIFKKIDAWRNIDMKKYPNRTKSTIYSSTAALGTIHINRLV